MTAIAGPSMTVAAALLAAGQQVVSLPMTILTILAIFLLVVRIRGLQGRWSRLTNLTTFPKTRPLLPLLTERKRLIYREMVKMVKVVMIPLTTCNLLYLM